MVSPTVAVCAAWTFCGLMAVLWLWVQDSRDRDLHERWLQDIDADLARLQDDIDRERPER